MNENAADPIHALAGALAEARRSATRLSMDDWLGQLPDAAAAYATQARVGRMLGWFGESTPQHWKSGGPSRSANLTHAPLPPGGVRIAPDGGTADMRDMLFHRRGIEAELALRLAREVSADEAGSWQGPNAAQFDPRDLVDAMCVAIEVVDSRWQAAPPNADRAQVALLNLADQQVHGALALGEWVAPVFGDWTKQACTVRIDDQPAQQFMGTHPLGDPAWLLPPWLAHLTRDGRSVPAGTVVTTGSWCGLIDVAAGDTVHVHFDGMGSLRLAL